MKKVLGYTVTVTAVTENVEMRGKEWGVVDHVVIEGSNQLKPKYDYTPLIQKTVTKEEKLYEQTVESLDINSVIAAVNNMTEVKVVKGSD